LFFEQAKSIESNNTFFYIVYIWYLFNSAATFELSGASEDKYCAKQVAVLMKAPFFFKKLSSDRFITNLLGYRIYAI
jgi:hypothetical protein